MTAERLQLLMRLLAGNSGTGSLDKAISPPNQSLDGPSGGAQYVRPATEQGQSSGALGGYLTKMVGGAGGGASAGGAAGGAGAAGL